MSQLSFSTQSVWNILSHSKIFEYSEKYKDFLNKAKTEFETIDFALKYLEQHGFKDINSLAKLQPGTKVYFNYENRLLLAFSIPQKPKLRFKFVISHVDTPRLDLKVKPLKQDSELVFLKTHYYGGVKKYQWLTIPLSLHGKIINSKGKTIHLNIGESENDPVLTIPDLLPHLSKKQLTKNAKEFIEAESLQAILGHIPPKLSNNKSNKKSNKETILTQILNILYKKYKITEKDFIRADLRLVPASKARDLGLDKGLILAYGQDDRVCAYTSLTAFVQQEPKSSYINSIILLDKEEVGSNSRSSARSEVIKYAIATVLKKLGFDNSEYALREAFINSLALSSDVDAVFNPIYSQPFDKSNTALLGHGPILIKYTGHGGKYLSSEAPFDYMHYIMDILDKAKVPWQTGMLGKVDEGGGGTIAKFFDNMGIKTVDFGPGVLSMHAPLEITSKADVYATYLAYIAFLK